MIAVLVASRSALSSLDAVALLPIQGALGASVYILCLRVGSPMLTGDLLALVRQVRPRSS